MNTVFNILNYLWAAIVGAFCGLFYGALTCVLILAVGSILGLMGLVSIFDFVMDNSLIILLDCMRVGGWIGLIIGVVREWCSLHPKKKVDTEQP